MTLPLTQSALENIAQSASETIFRMLGSYTIPDPKLQELASHLDDSIAFLLREDLLAEEEEL